MDEFEKNEILKQVETILQFCQDIVSRLSSLPPPPAITEANKSIAKFSDEEEEEVHQDGAGVSILFRNSITFQNLIVVLG